jgi:hypothetical protein
MSANSCYAFQTATFTITPPSQTGGTSNNSLYRMAVNWLRAELLDSEEVNQFQPAPCTCFGIYEEFLFLKYYCLKDINRFLK